MLLCRTPGLAGLEGASEAWTSYLALFAAVQARPGNCLLPVSTWLPIHLMFTMLAEASEFCLLTSALHTNFCALSLSYEVVVVVVLYSIDCLRCVSKDARPSIQRASPTRLRNPEVGDI